MRKVLGVDAVKREMEHILHLPLWERLTHRRARRVVRGVVGAAVMMLSASYVACNAEFFAHATMMPHFVVDGLAYLVHGIGAIPVVKYAEPAWMLVIGE